MRRLALAVVMLGLAGLLTFGGGQAAGAAMRIARREITLRGTAQGGTLILGKRQKGSSQYVSIRTLPGQNASEVTAALAKAIGQAHAAAGPLRPLTRTCLWGGRIEPEYEGATLRMVGGYFLAGTEAGLGILEPPRNVSLSYDEAADRLVAQWNCPPTGYDWVDVRIRWHGFEHGTRFILAGDATQAVLDQARSRVDLDDLDCLVSGRRKGISSTVGGVHATVRIQEDRLGCPFTRGVMPTWDAWSSRSDLSRSGLSQGEFVKEAVAFNRAASLLSKPFHQRMHGGGKMCGVYRLFYGLKPGHTYRLIGGFNTLAMDTVEGPWRLGLWALPLTMGDPNRAPASDALPGLVRDLAGGGAVVPQVIYGPDRTTGGQWRLACAELAQGETRAETFTLSETDDSLLVVAGFEAADLHAEVGFSGVRLEDVTGLARIRPLSELQAEETGWMARVLRSEKLVRGRLAELRAARERLRPSAR